MLGVHDIKRCWNVIYVGTEPVSIGWFAQILESESWKLAILRFHSD